MENVYDIRKDKNLQFISSAEHSSIDINGEKLRSMAIEANLFCTGK